jgi:hypothetical protein
MTEPIAMQVDIVGGIARKDLRTTVRVGAVATFRRNFNDGLGVEEVDQMVAAEISLLGGAVAELESDLAQRWGYDGGQHADTSAIALSKRHLRHHLDSKAGLGFRPAAATELVHGRPVWLRPIKTSTEPPRPAGVR